MTRFARLGFLILATSAFAAPPPPDGTEEIEMRLRLAAEAEAAGDADQARTYRLAALSLSPRSTKIMSLLARADGADEENAALWAHVAVTRSGGGKLVLSGWE